MVHPVSFMCLEGHFNSSRKLRKKKKNSHANVKCSMDLLIYYFENLNADPSADHSSFIQQ